MRPERQPRAAARTLVLLAVMVAMVAVVGCSRLTFVKADMARKDFRRTAPEVQIETDDRNSGPAAAMTFIRQGQQHLGQGDLDAAARAGTQALKLAPESPLAHTLLALVADRRGDAATAGDHYRRAADLAPTRGGMLNNYGTWLCAQGQALASLDWFDRALADRGYATPAVALANAGSCAERAGKDELAGQYLHRAIEVDPVNPLALGALAEREFAAGRAFQARAFSQRRLAAAPADPRALLLASQIEEKLGDKAAADRYVQQLGAQFPTWSGSQAGDDGRQ